MVDSIKSFGSKFLLYFSTTYTVKYHSLRMSNQLKKMFGSCVSP